MQTFSTALISAIDHCISYFASLESTRSAAIPSSFESERRGPHEPPLPPSRRCPPGETSALCLVDSHPASRAPPAQADLARIVDGSLASTGAYEGAGMAEKVTMDSRGSIEDEERENCKCVALSSSLLPSLELILLPSVLGDAQSGASFVVSALLEDPHSGDQANRRRLRARAAPAPTRLIRHQQGSLPPVDTGDELLLSSAFLSRAGVDLVEADAGALRCDSM